MAIEFIFTAYEVDGVGQAVEIGNVMLGLRPHSGAIGVTEWQRNAPSWEAELNACQHYFEKSYDVNTLPSTLTLNGINVLPVSSVGALSSVPFKVHKRIAPTVVFWRPSTSASNVWEHTGGTTGMTVLYAGESSFLPSKDDSPNAVTANTTVSGHWTADAEFVVN
jgi:hypothetical protein